MKKLDKEKEICNRLAEYIPTNNYKARQNRLKELVGKHGIEFVALASGLTEGSLTQYLRVRTPQSISENTVKQAETVLEGL